MEALTVALTGNPNTGKTTVFNMLTGARQQVGNYPGVTVEITEGRAEHNDAATTISDLPGTYSLAAHSEDERTARNFLLEVPTDVVIDVVDATQLERNLYLALQLIEFGKPLVIALNMSDAAEAQGLRIDHQALSDHLGVPCIPTSGRNRRGRNELLDAAVDQARHHRAMVRNHGHPVEQNRVPYARELEDVLREIQEHLIATELIAKDHPARWYALKLLENDTQIIERYALQEAEPVAAAGRDRLRAIYGQDPVAAIADRRHEVIAEICKHCVASPQQPKRDITGTLDAVLTHRWLGPAIFFALMYAVFHLVFTLGAPPMGWLEQFFGWLAGAVDGLWSADEPSALRSLLVNGIIPGVGGVLVFTPNILLLFLAIAALEASGYMSRAAFLMDRYMHKLGLHGKSFIPMLIGFGCTVPGIMATRILESRRDRLTTMLILPLMSCGARIPIYMLIIPSFFAPAYQGLALFSIYLLGIVLALVLARVLKSTLFRGVTPHFLLELPGYRRPALRDLALFTWQRTWEYIKKAGTIILAASIILWALSTYPRKTDIDPDLPGEERQALQLTHTVIGRTGKALEPVMQPAGFDWRLTTGFLGAFAAKEAFVTQMSIVFAVEDPEEGDGLAIRRQLNQRYPALVGVCILIFSLMATPCVATLAITRRESGSWRWALAQWGGLTVLAYILCVIVYQTGRALGFG